MRGHPVWDARTRPTLPILQGDTVADVCVVGLGGSGLSAVLRLVRAGLDVVGLDAGRVADGAAGRNGGLLLAGTAAFHHDAARALGRERATTLYRLTLDEIGRILAEAPGAGRRVGSLRIAATDDERADCAAQEAAMRADGLPVRWYEGPEGTGLLFAGDGAFDPLRRCGILARRASGLGARLYERSPAVRTSGDEVRTPSGRVRCSAVVVAVDGRLERLLPELEGRVRTARLQMAATAPTRELPLPRPVYLRHGYEYYRRTDDGRIALGGFRDRGGHGEWTGDAEPTPAVQRHLDRFLREGLGVRARVTHRWAASVGFVEGVLPIAAQVRERVWAIGGYNGTGNVVGALLGRAVAERIVTGGSSVLRAFAGGDG